MTDQKKVGVVTGVTSGTLSAVLDSGIAYDTVILEFGRWVHLSFTNAPRGRVLTIYDPGEGYLAGLLDEGRNPVV